MLNDNNFIKWLARKASTINEASNATKILITFIFLYEIYFLPGHFYFAKDFH